jgi:hypothetical protein
MRILTWIWALCILGVSSGFLVSRIANEVANKKAFLEVLQSSRKRSVAAFGFPLPIRHSGAALQSPLTRLRMGRVGGGSGWSRSSSGETLPTNLRPL